MLNEGGGSSGMLEVDDENNAGPDTERKDATTKMNLDLDSNK